MAKKRTEQSVELLNYLSLRKRATDAITFHLQAIICIRYTATTNSSSFSSMRNRKSIFLLAQTTNAIVCDRQITLVYRLDDVIANDRDQLKTKQNIKSSEKITLAFLLLHEIEMTF